MGLDLHCTPERTPPPLFKDSVRLILALVFAYNMISAWDAVLDRVVEKYLGLRGRSIKHMVGRAVMSTVAAVLVLWAVRIDVDDVFGSTLEP